MLPKVLLASFLAGLLVVCSACQQPGCSDSDVPLTVELGYPGMEGWQPIEDEDQVLVSPGSQGWGLMVEVNIRIAGLSADSGAYSTADVQIIRSSEDQEPLTAPGTRVLAALCQEDGTLLSRNRRVEFSEDHMVFDELEGIDEGFDAVLKITVEFHDGTTVRQELDVHLYREPEELDSVGNQ